MAKHGKHRAPKKPLMDLSVPPSVIGGGLALTSAFAAVGHIAPAQLAASTVPGPVETSAPDALDAKHTANLYLESRTANLVAQSSRSRRIATLTKEIASAQKSMSIASVNGAKTIDIADNYQGVPYRRGGTSPKGFDCSGYTQFVYRQMGISIPRVAQAQSHWADKVSADSVKTGDLVFFHSKNGYVYHVAIYAGHGMIWHAPYPGKSVEKVKIFGHVSYGRAPKAAINESAAKIVAEKTAELSRVQKQKPKAVKVIIKKVTASPSIDYTAPHAAN